MTDLFFVLAMMGGPAGQGQSNPMTMMMPMVIIMIIFYFMLIRPQQRKEKERRKMIDEIKSGERILFSGGITGTVSNVKEGTLMVKIAENVKIEIAKAAVMKILDKNEKVSATE